MIQYDYKTYKLRLIQHTQGYTTLYTPAQHKRFTSKTFKIFFSVDGKTIKQITLKKLKDLYNTYIKLIKASAFPDVIQATQFFYNNHVTFNYSDNIITFIKLTSGIIAPNDSLQLLEYYNID